MVKKQHLDILKKGVIAWNQWREKNPEIKPDLSGANLRTANLQSANFTNSLLIDTDLRGANLIKTNLTGAKLNRANLSYAQVVFANLNEASLIEANLYRANLSKAELSKANLFHASLVEANIQEANLKAILMEANLDGANLKRAVLSEVPVCWASLICANLDEADLHKTIFKETNFTRASLVEANLQGANLMKAILIETDFTRANLTGCRIYGISAWNLKLHGATQSDLIITPKEEPTITVDNLEVAQFIYLMLHNEKIRDVINTIGKKGVLILGRFAPSERKFVLEAIRRKLRQLDYVPIVFDFERPRNRDFTETIMTLAGMCRFIIADITNPKSSPLELEAIVPDYMIPLVPIIQEGEKPFSMFRDLANKYDWVLPVLDYDSVPTLMSAFEEAVIEPALDMHNRLMAKKAQELPTRHVRDYL